ncbi:CLUMA_CG006643, isoform A [Clunio marinus]|uniref:CLUMA_CG006643, isoform A n=1 Tax=Clunio marinus TaxID=568069 RepID=A0A1J1HY18_9DIPT|nr:CLUMA_CG006643, isoform A [Clunio marinus]
MIDLATSTVLEWGIVTGISLRTDDPPLMTTSSISGQIAFWNLEEKKVVGTLLAHFFKTSSDNSLKMWIFDNSMD